MPDIFVAPEEEEKPQIKPAEKTEEKKVLSPHEVEHPVGMFSSFIEHPKNIHFKDQYEDEIILLFLRRHLITNLPWIIFALFLLITPMLTFFLVTLANVSLSFIPAGYIFIFLIFYYLVIVMYIFINFIHWFYNIFLVTQIRIIDIDYSDIVFQNVDATKLSQVEETRYVQTGFIRTFFNYGDVFVETAAAVSNFEARAVPEPQRAVRIIEPLIGGRKHAR